MLTKSNMGSLYARGLEGFDAWLAYLLDPENAPKFDADYVAKAGEMGLATWRFKRLATFAFTEPEPKMDFIIRYEFLLDDLREVARTHLAHALTDVHAALDWIANSKPINTSSRKDRGAGVTLSEATTAKLMEREAYLYDTFYQRERDRCWLAPRPEPALRDTAIRPACSQAPPGNRRRVRLSETPRPRHHAAVEILVGVARHIIGPRHGLALGRSFEIAERAGLRRPEMGGDPRHDVLETVRRSL